jgi:hypothetical protein
MPKFEIGAKIVITKGLALGPEIIAADVIPVTGYGAAVSI